MGLSGIMRIICLLTHELVTFILLSPLAFFVSFTECRFRPFFLFIFWLIGLIICIISFLIFFSCSLKPIDLS